MREGTIFNRARIAATQRIEDAGFMLEHTMGADNWRTFMENQKLKLPDCPDLFISTALCPKVQNIDPRTAQSFVVYDQECRSVAGVVVRTYPPRLKHLLEHGQLWLPDEAAFASDFVPGDALFDVLAKQIYVDPVTGAEYPILESYVTQRGGLFVHPDHRGSGLGSALSIISNVCAFRLYGHNWTVALKREPHDPWSSGCAYLGEAEIGTPRIKFWLAWYSRSDAAKDLAGDAADDANNVVPMIGDRP